MLPMAQGELSVSNPETTTGVQLLIFLDFAWITWTQAATWCLIGLCSAAADTYPTHSLWRKMAHLDAHPSRDRVLRQARWLQTCPSLSL